MNPDEADIRQMLHRRANEVASHGPPPVQETLAAGRRSRTRQRAGLLGGVASIAVVAVGAAQMINGTPDSSSNDLIPASQLRTTEPSTSVATAPTPRRRPPASDMGKETPCSQLPRIPRDIEIDTGLDARSGQLMLSYTQPGPRAVNRSFIVNYEKDASCREDPGVLQVVNHALRTGGLPTLTRLLPAESRWPAAGICLLDTETVVTVNFNPDTPAPRCIEVGADQRLRVVNSSNNVGEPGATLTVSFANFSPRTLHVGEATVFDRPLGDYLSAGVHSLSVRRWGVARHKNTQVQESSCGWCYETCALRVAVNRPAHTTEGAGLR